jgi:hypothetical protein
MTLRIEDELQELLNDENGEVFSNMPLKSHPNRHREAEVDLNKLKLAASNTNLLGSRRKRRFSKSEVRQTARPIEL